MLPEGHYAFTSMRFKAIMMPAPPLLHAAAAAAATLRAPMLRAASAGACGYVTRYVTPLLLRYDMMMRR